MRDVAAANARIVELEAKVARLEALEVSRATCCLAAERYVAACLAIREAPYPSEAFTAAVAHASARYHALVEAFK